MSETTVAPYMRVEAPPIGRPVRGGLLDNDEFIVEVSDPHLGGGVEYRPRLDCHRVGLAPGMCDPAIIGDGEKEWTEPTLMASPAFAVYKGAGCYIIGEPYEEQARAGLELGEGNAVARAWIALLHGGVFGNEVSLLSPGVDLALVTAVGRMEDALSTYPGQGVLFASRTVATWMIAMDVAQWENGRLVTALGTPIVAEEPLSQGPTDLDGGDWIYGVINPRFYKGANVIEFGTRDLETNQTIRIAERMWSVSMECDILALSIVDPFPVPTTEPEPEP